MPDSEPGAEQSQRPPPRSSSPAKRLHSDMVDDNMDLDAPATARRNSGQASPRTTKALSATPAHRSARAASVDMADADNEGPAATSVDAARQTDQPTLDEQVTQVMVMMQAPLHEHHEGYVISEKWLERVWARTSENISRPQDFSKDATLGPIGPVDNAGLVDDDAARDDLMDQNGEDFVPLSKATQMGQDFEIIPTKAWEHVVQWYGLREGTPVIRRYVHNTVPDKTREDLSYEIHPPVFTIRKVRKIVANTAPSVKPASKLVASRYESFLEFLEAAKKAAGIKRDNKVRVWRILNASPSHVSQQPQPSGMLTPDASPRDGSPAAPASNQQIPLIMDVTNFNALSDGAERELVTGKDEKANEEFNESMTLAGAGLTQDQVIVLEEHDEKGDYISDLSKMVSKNKTSPPGAKPSQSNANSGRSTPTGALTRGRARNGKVRGHVGLTNLGNTCYMNSALQCLRSVEELSLYFLSNRWKDEVNADNPIGHKGAIAKVYAGLLGSIYDLNGVSAFSPKNFKTTLGRANSLFSGYGQQDSQEFVSWLVDALHEDLNRVKQKPYRENPDSDDNTFRDPNAIKELGETYRDNHKARNDSVAMDLFSGFYKNTMVCPECDKVSITFDPYSQLTLQLPIEQSWSHTVTYVPLHGKPYQLEVDIDKNASIRTLKEYVGKRGGNVPASRIMASEVYSHKFYKHLDDKSSISESNIGTRDDIYFYELDVAPSNWPPPKKKGSKYKMLLSQGSSDEDIPESASPLHDRILVPVFSRGPNMSSYRGSNLSMTLWPFFVVLTREEAKDYDSILRKVLAKVAQMSTRPFLEEVGVSSSLDRSRSGSDVVLTTEEDASPTDPQIKDGSVEGEDLVEVTMTDSAEPLAEEQSANEGLPEVLKSGSLIPEQCRQLFEMKHTRKGGEFVTTGWSTVDHSRGFEPISKRIRVPPSREESVQSSPSGSDASSSDEDADTPQSLGQGVDAAMEEATVSSDEDAPKSFEHSNPSTARGGRQNKKKNKKMRKQDRKHRNNKNFKGHKNKIPEQPNYPEEVDDESDHSLIRMGEALVLDWAAGSFDALFGGSAADDSRGQDALKFIETREDSEVQEKRAKRTARRKHGITLDECFTETAKSEVLSEDNAWYCNRCKELRRATKTLELWTVPDILIIHLKRFSGFRSLRDKVDEFVDFPVHALDLSGKVGFPEDKDLTYDLFAVDNHYGGLGGGHYTATARNFFDGQWYDYNDSIVSRSSGEKAVNRNAYLLFYRRRTPHPLGPTALQTLVKTAESDPNPESEEDEGETDRTARTLEAGNGQRLDASSRNGSSSAFTGTGAAVGAGALREGGSQPSQVGKTAGAVAATEMSTDDEDLPPYSNRIDPDQDEGYVDGSYNNALGDIYGPLHDEPAWSFQSLGQGSFTRHDDSDDMASDMPALGSEPGEDQEARLMQDFGDDENVTHAGVSTPIEGIRPVLGGELGDGDVHEIRVPSTE